MIVRITDAKQEGCADLSHIWHTKNMPTPVEDHSAARLGGERSNSLWFVVPGAFDGAVYLEDDRAVVLDGDEVAALAGILSVVPGEACLDPVNFVPGHI